MIRLVWIFILCGVTFAYDIADFTRDAKSYHERQLTALGGLKLNLTGEITEPGKDPFDFEATYFTRDGKWRVEGTLRPRDEAEGLPISVLYDGQKTWATVLGMKLEVPRRDVKDRVRGYVYWDEPAAGSRVAGEEIIAGRACWLIETPLRESDGASITMRSWYDQQHYVLLQSETSYDKKPVRMEFGDLRGIAGGYAIPHHLRAFQNETQVADVRVTGSATGAEVSDSLFDAAQMPGEDFPDMSELMRSMKIFGKVFTNEVSKLLKE